MDAAEASAPCIRFSGNPQSLGMVGWCTEVGFQYRLSGWCSEGAVCGFKSDEYSVNLFEKLGIVELHRPTMLGLVVVVKDSETVRRFVVQIVAVAPPRCIHEFSIGGVLRRKIERIEDK